MRSLFLPIDFPAGLQVLLSKTDLASPSKIEQVTNFIQKMRPGARILRSQRGAVPLKMILDVRLNESASKNSDETAIVNHEHESEVAADHSDCDHDHGICNHDHEHDHDHDHEHEHEQRHEHDHEHNHEHEAKSNHIEVDGFMSTSFQYALSCLAEAPKAPTSSCVKLFSSPLG